jgi:Domain of unknown function (DUF4082)
VPEASLARLGRITKILVVIIGSAASVAHAGPIVDFTGGVQTAAVAGNDDTLGFSFDVITTTTISGLGFFDAGSDGLINSHQVGLWTAGGTLLASATLDNSSNIVASTSNLGDWRETDIGLLTLNLGSYVLGAFYRDVSVSAEDDAVVVANASSVSGVSYGHTRSGFPGFTFPNVDQSVADAGTFGPMAFTSRSATAPEPANLGLSICALALFGVGFRRHSRSRIQKI